jgi:hypothetical protein
MGGFAIAATKKPSLFLREGFVVSVRFLLGWRDSDHSYWAAAAIDDF